MDMSKLKMYCIVNRVSIINRLHKMNRVKIWTDLFMWEFKQCVFDNFISKTVALNSLGNVSFTNMCMINVTVLSWLKDL